MHTRRLALLLVATVAALTWSTGGAPAPSIAAQPGEFVGTWRNKNASTNSVTKIVISISGSTLRIYSYGKCTPTDCDWSTYSGVGGPRTPPVSDAADGVITIVWPFGFQTTTQTLTLLSNGTLRVRTVTDYADTRPTRDLTEDFANTTDRTLKVGKTGSGTGGITSSPGGINCGGTCSANFTYWANVSLTAKPAEGSKFEGWEGGCSGSSCSLKMSLDRSATAKFSLVAVGFSVVRSGEGTITSSPNGIGCGSSCSTSFPWGTSVTLKATPVARWGFLGWSGGCTGTNSTCTLIVKTPVSVKATFGSVKLTATTVAARWQKSRLTGTMTLSGEATKDARLAVTVTPTAGGKPFVNRSVDVSAGTFRTTVPLPKRLLPGRYALRVEGTMGGVVVPAAVRAMRVPAPREGVVAKEHISTTPKGSAVRKVALATKKLYAHFTFAQGALSKLPLTVEWYGPRGTFIGKKPKPRARLVESTISFPPNYPAGKKRGIWGCILRAGGVAVDDVFVRVG
jgi:hypothetical protein